jgi:hypothetical protein
MVMQLQPVHQINNSHLRVQNPEPEVTVLTADAVESPTVTNLPESVKTKRFIESNTEPVSLLHLQNDCIIPVFRDNEKTISHYEFIDAVDFCTQQFFRGSQILEPEIRVSHQINGRIPTALHKKVSDLEEFEKTRYYERQMFIIEVPSIYEDVNGSRLNLTIGGVRALNHESLFSKKSIEKFKVFIGFQNLVCTNLLVSTDGVALEIRVSSIEDLVQKVFELFENYDMKKHLRDMENFGRYNLTEHQFAQLIGKARLYPFLPPKQKKEIPQLIFNDTQLNSVAKDYYLDKSFCRSENGDIDLWRLYQLLTGVNKSSYIDSFLDRSLNAFTFTESLVEASGNTSKSHWFLS